MQSAINSLIRYASAQRAWGPSHFENSAVSRAMQNLGISPDKLPQYIHAIRKHLRNPETANDPLSQEYRRHMDWRGHGVPSIAHMTNGAHPIVGYYAHQFGDYEPPFELHVPTASEDADLLDHTEPIDLADVEGSHEDFDLPQEHDLPWAHEIIRKPAARTPMPRLRQIRQDIADTLARRGDVMSMLQDKHGLDEAMAGRHFENYKRLASKPSPATRPDAAGRLPGKGKIRSTNRVYSRYDGIIEAIQRYARTVK